MSCEFAGREEIAERYILGELDETEAERFEEHFFGCDRCFNEVKTLGAVRETLRGMPLTVPARQPARWAFPVWTLAAVLLAGISLGVSALWFSRSSPTIPQPKQAADIRAETTRLAALRMAELATVRPPPFNPARLRGVQEKASEQFRDAMDLYARGDYQGAIPGLIAASDADRGDAAGRFFLGICLLMVDKPEPASEAFRQTLTLGDSPYEEEAHFYLGKALLRLHQIDGASEQLRQVIEMHGDLEAAARQLRGELLKIPPVGGR